jgi:hypothetical protein
MSTFQIDKGGRFRSRFLKLYRWEKQTTWCATSVPIALSARPYVSAR